MKTIITLLLALAAFTLHAQNTVKIDFPEEVVIQDIEIEYQFNTYYAQCRGDGIKKFDIGLNEKPLHLIVNTKDNKKFNLIIIGSPDEVEIETVQWERKDMVLDLNEKD